MSKRKALWFKGLKWSEQQFEAGEYRAVDKMFDSWVAPEEFKIGVADYVSYYYNVLHPDASIL
jgi:hypothetical protein